jgi:uncharacterized membrane protein YfcA
MEILIIPIITFLLAIITFFSGFGLGTILTPVMMVFFPLDVAIAVTGVIHLSNNLFKLSIIGAKADKNVLIRFGIPSILAAFLGAWLLLNFPDLPNIYTYSIYEKTFFITPLKLIIALLLIVFALADLLPSLQKIQFDKNKLPLGGFLSGFFGGFSGHQGALRSAFLIKSGLSKEAYIGTAVLLSTMIDLTRIGVYASKINSIQIENHYTLVILSIISGILGAFVGNKLLSKITFKMIQIIVAYLLIGISICLGIGLL